MLMESQKHYLIQLKNLLLNKSLINNIFLISFGIIILLFSINTYYCFILFAIYSFYLYKRNKSIFILLISITVIIIITYLLRLYFVNDKRYNSFSGIVINITENDSYNKLIVKNNWEKVIVYDYDFIDINIGDKISAIGRNSEITPNRIEGLFNYQRYYFSQNIISIIKADDIMVSKDFNRYYLRRMMYSYIANNFEKESASYIMGMVLGDSTELEEITVDNIRINGISHLFAISGLHISLLISILSKIFSYLKMKDSTTENIIIIILSLYLIITNFAISILRASLMYFVSIMNKRYSIGLSSLDIISFIFIILIIYNPNFMYYLSFVLSFCASFFIILLSETLKRYKLNSIKELLIITTLLQVITLPIVVNINYSFNVLSIITNVVFITLVTIIILPSTFLVLIFPFLGKVYSYIISSFSLLNNFFSKYLSLNINLPAFNHLEIVIYYCLLLFIIIGIDYLKNKRIKKIFIVFTISFFFLYYNKINLNYQGKVYFLDIYEGDCTIIDLPLNKGIVIIDTGTEKCDEVIDFLKSKGVRRIDYLVLTHNHSDHSGNSVIINNEFNVNKIIISAYDSNVNNSYYQNKIIRVKKNDIFSISGYTFNVLGPYQKANNENDNSIILYVKLGNWKYLFLGDASIEKENELIPLNLDVDCIKVGHHGSKTATSEIFYQKVNPLIAIIEVGRVERYGFPHEEVIRILSKYNLFRTDKNYSIKIEFTKKESIISSLK